MAKKSGKPNDDFPDIEKNQNVAKTNVHRFALTIEKAAIVDELPGRQTVDMGLSYQDVSIQNPALHLEKKSNNRRSTKNVG
mmetsp:Transcript_8546/g.7897  ORF Transcript_8546/g.7897 Transcript_8546/m.7897 type:complete len:81 (-) Transcript_8546:132-374(-)